MKSVPLRLLFSQEGLNTLKFGLIPMPRGPKIVVEIEDSGSECIKMMENKDFINNTYDTKYLENYKKLEDLEEKGE